MALFKQARFIHRLLEKGMTAVYPARCLLCQTLTGEKAAICESCYQALPWNTNSCSQCALPLAHPLNMTTETSTILCGRCQRQTPYYDCSYSIFRYEGDVVQMVHQLKFQQNLVYSKLMATMFSENISERLNASASASVCIPDCLLPVPLHKKRLRQRGFNQSIELARTLSKNLNITLNIGDLMRVRATVSQSGLDARQRKKNIRAAFALREGFSASHVAIIDDVVTTGSTVNEIAKLLKASGVERVDVYSFARA